MTQTKPYRDYSDFLAEHFPCKVQKIAVNAGLTCPNRDGTIGLGGCIYCDNSAFNPSYCDPSLPVGRQIEAGRRFFARKYRGDMRYLAYFQAYTNTYGAPDRLMGLYNEALAEPDVAGLIIGTRPDCLPQPLLDDLAALARRHFVMMEFGAESCHDATLRLVNRGHTWADTVDAVTRTARSGMPVGLHLIMGLPGETPEMMLQTIDAVNLLPIDVVKIHQLQTIRGTLLASGNYPRMAFTAESYADLCCEIISRLRSDIAIERFVGQSPPGMIEAPHWGIKPGEFNDLLISKFNTLNITR
ncbi:MAG: TIGR01212 family radical SAM protein [Muribaculaceae bacterium]|nr:TIGR01212 family radical SAM protein [Muribaculaceae bacterium]